MIFLHSAADAISPDGRPARGCPKTCYETLHVARVIPTTQTGHTPGGEFEQLRYDRPPGGPGDRSALFARRHDAGVETRGTGGLMQRIDFELRGDYIALDSLLKATGLASSGGNAKQMIAAGQVQVDGQSESRRGRKLRAGQVVELAGARISLRAARQEGRPPSGASVPDAADRGRDAGEISSVKPSDSGKT